MSDATLRANNRRVLWLVVAICVMPLVPYALKGTGV